MAGNSLQAARDRWRTVDGLRRWAEGSLSDQAAVELLVSWSAGCLVRPGAVWVRPCVAPGWFWLDADALADRAATRAGDERRVLLLAAALVGGDPWTRRRVVNLGRAAA
jgi:hypothetical protein